MEYLEKSKSFDHQAAEFRDHWSDKRRGLLWEMGTGKTKETIDQAAALYEAGEINCLLVVAPDGVHLNWITDEIPAHLPDRLRANLRTFCYQTAKAQTKRHMAECMEVISHPGLLVVAMSYDAVTTEETYQKDPITGKRKLTWKGGKAYLWDILRERRTMYVADEARRIKNPKADRTKIVVKSAVHAPYRRLLNGTPVPNGPFDIYSQMMFLDEHFWRPHGISNFGAFKTMFGVFEKAAVRGPGGVLREFDQLLSYRNLDLLHRILGTICSRVTKEDVLNLPPELYSRQVFEMTSQQKKLYDQLSDDYLGYLDGHLITAPLAITRLLRFQQITSGFIPVEDGPEPILDIGKVNPRLELLESFCEDLPHKGIIWGRFTRTIDKIMDMLGKNAVRYDGLVSSEDRAKNKEIFKHGDAQFFVAKQSTGGEGLTLVEAKTSIYMENTFDLADRQQSAARNHRIGQTVPVNCVDFAALGTVDEYIIKSLIEKFDISNEITGDQVKAWLQPAA